MEPIATQQQQQPNFQIPNPYDIEYEDYDSDDDDYGNNKRLKIDESEDPPVEAMETRTESAPVDPKPVASVVELNSDKNQVQSNNKQEDMATKATASVAVEQPENQINKDTKTVDTSKPELEHENEASNSSSVASSKSASSAMTAISAISSDSLPASAMSSVCDKSDQGSVDFKSSQQQQQDTKTDLTSSVEETKAESLEKPRENLESKSQLDQQEDSKSSDTDSLKVPSLKIIVSGNGSLPYVKGQPTTGAISDAATDSEVLASTEQRSTRNEKKQRTATAAASSDTVTTPVKHGDSTTFNVNDSPANNSR